MYRAKSLGRSRHEFFDAKIRPGIVDHMELETDLRHALERGQLQVYLQPIVALSDERLTGFEAVVHWQHPERGLIPPSRFIPIAEETGLIIPIGWWALSQVCRLLHDWQTPEAGAATLSISVNLSGAQFQQPDLPELIDRALKETGADAKRLKLELTESILIEDAKAAVLKIAHLHRLGIELYMDDFGTGYSSLSYLRRLNVDTLKIEKAKTLRSSAASCALPMGWSLASSPRAWRPQSSWRA
jgi:EAL domain-containing protein (putative c-di-GMP-specific phosphodiesterase class I)